MSDSRMKSIVVLILTGCVAGLVLGGLGGLLGRTIGSQSTTGWGDLVGAVGGAGLGYLVGVGLGVVLMGRRLLPAGSSGLAVLGSFLGGLLVLLLAEPLRLNQNTIVLQGVFVILPATLSAVAFAVPWRRG